jgi:serine/threonine protein kinase
VVHSALNKRTNDRLAIKIYDKEKILSNASRKRSVSREITLLKRLDHPNIVKLYESIDTPKSLNLVMEQVDGKSLYDYVKEKNYAGRYIPEIDVRHIIKQLAEGVEFMHSKQIAHRDLKLDNIILLENKRPKNLSEPVKKPFTIKIIDFGFSVTTQKL